MKRRRSSPRSTLLTNDPQKAESVDETKPTLSASNKVQRASAEPDEDKLGSSHEAKTTSVPSAPLTGALKCSLPPTCSGRGKEVFFRSVDDMERHHATYHTHTCLETGCGTVFPDARFLMLVSIVLTEQPLMCNILIASFQFLVYENSINLNVTIH